MRVILVLWGTEGRVYSGTFVKGQVNSLEKSLDGRTEKNCFPG